MTTDNKLTQSKLMQVVDSANRLMAMMSNKVIAIHKQVVEQHSEFKQKFTAIETKHQQMAPLLVPVGVPLPWPSATPPTGFFKCDGSRFNQSDYPQLAAVYPDGILPDLRGEFIRGWDDGRGVDANRQVLEWQKGTLTITDPDWSGIGLTSPIHLNDKATMALPDLGADTVDKNLYNYGRAWTSVPNQSKDLDSYGWAGGYGSTRPRNIAFLYIVRAA